MKKLNKNFIGILIVLPVLLMAQTEERQVSLNHFSTSTLVPPSNGQNQEMQAIAPSKSPSKGAAFLLSFLIPGTGEYYAGSSKMAKIFLGTELALWSAFGSLRYYGSSIEHDYKLYAKAHAGVDISGKDHDYFVDIENFNNLENYNQYKLQQRSLNEVYPETEEYQWKWDSQDNRFKYSKMRVDSDNAFRHSLFIAGGIFLNHIISSIDAVRLVNKSQKLQTNKTVVGLAPLPGGAQVSLVKIF